MKLALLPTFYSFEYTYKCLNLGASLAKHSSPSVMKIVAPHFIQHQSIISVNTVLSNKYVKCDQLLRDDCHESVTMDNCARTNVTNS